MRFHARVLAAALTTSVSPMKSFVIASVETSAFVVAPASGGGGMSPIDEDEEQANTNPSQRKRTS